MTPSDWTTLAIAGAVALSGAALVLGKLSGPVTLTGGWQRRGDFAVFDALFAFGLKRSARRQRLELKIYTTLKTSPLEPGDGQPEGRSDDDAGRTKLSGGSGRRNEEAALPSRDSTRGQDRGAATAPSPAASGG